MPRPFRRLFARLSARSRPARPAAPLLVAALVSLAACAGEPAPEPPDPATKMLLLQGEEALRARDFDRAVALADSAAARAPRAVEPDFLRGLIHAQMMRWDEADAAYRRVIERAPRFPGAWNNLGNNAMRRGEYRRAIGFYFEELGVEPAPVPWTSIGHLYRELGVVDSAAFAFQRALALDSTHVPARLAYAQLLENDGAFDEALALVEEAHRLAPDDPDVRYRLGNLLAKLGRAEDAVPHLQAVTEAVPWHNESHYALSRALQQLGRAEESRELLARAEKLWAHQADISALQKGVTNEPANPYTHAALATAYRTAGRYEEAVQSYRLALALAPDNLEFQNNLASLHFLRRDTVAAIATYQRIVSADPTMKEAWLNLGVLHALSGEAEPARRAWLQVLAVDPANEQARAFLRRIERTP